MYHDVEMLDVYFAAKEFKRTNAKLVLDAIPSELVACVKLNTALKEAIRLRLPWERLIRQMVVPSHLKDFVLPKETTPVHVSLAVDAMHEEICRCGLLRPWTRRDGLVTECGVFLIGKSEPYQTEDGQTEQVARLVMDARPANSCTPQGEHFGMFQLNDLLEMIVLLETIYAVNVDYRHYFHQLPLPQQLVKYFVMKFSKQWLVPRAHPMGWTSSPVRGQSITWVSVLYREDTEDSLGVKLEEILTMCSSSLLPPYVNLRDNLDGKIVGRIFVILDNVCVVTNSEPLTSKWETRIKRNCTLLGIIQKECVASIASVGTLLKGMPAFSFAGIEFSGYGWRPKNHGQMPKLVTRRQVASVVGSLLWECRVRGQQPLSHQGLMKIACLIGSSSSDWDEEMELSSKDQLELRRLWSIADERLWTYNETWIPTETLYLVTDATPTTLAYAFLLGPSEIGKSGFREMPEANIGERELEAVVMGVRSLSPKKPTLVKVATDNEGVRHSINKKWSKSVRFVELLEELLDNELLHVHAYRVSSMNNFADELSRGTCMKKQKIRISWDILQKGY